jgi:hypothetical protein
MRKKLNTDAISNELRGASAFFPSPPNQDRSTGDPAPAGQPSPERPSNQVPGHPDVQTPGLPEAQTPRHLDTLASGHLDTSFDLSKRVVREIRQTLRLTEGEFRRLGAVQMAISEHLGVTRIEKNDMLRAALHRLFEDFEEQGVESDLLKRLRKKYR